jgi:hypothetical protein
MSLTKTSMRVAQPEQEVGELAGPGLVTFTGPWANLVQPHSTTLVPPRIYILRCLSFNPRPNSLFSRRQLDS